jgi:hypothetical protein
MDHFHQFRDSLKNTVITKHFHRDMPDFDPEKVVGSDAQTHLHKYEENIEGNHIFRALLDHVHIVFAVTKQHDAVFLRAFHNFKEYKKFLEDKKAILHLISNSSTT